MSEDGYDINLAHRRIPTHFCAGTSAYHQYMVYQVTPCIGWWERGTKQATINTLDLTLISYLDLVGQHIDDGFQLSNISNHSHQLFSLTQNAFHSSASSFWIPCFTTVYRVMIIDNKNEPKNVSKQKEGRSHILQQRKMFLPHFEAFKHTKERWSKPFWSLPLLSCSLANWKGYIVEMKPRQPNARQDYWYS